MRILLDNCVDRRFVHSLIGHDVSHALDHGWDKLTNGKLLSACDDEGIDVLITVDKNMRFQQNLATRRVALITLDVRSIDIDSLLDVRPRLLKLLEDGLSPGSSIVL